MRGRLRRPPRIALYGLFGIDSFGNEGSLEAMIRFLRRARPDAELVCVCGNPEQVRQDHGISAARMRTPGFTRPWARKLDRLLLRIPRTLDILVGTVARARRYDVIVVPGGGMLEDYCDRPAGEPLSLFLWSLGARLSGGRVAFISVGAGPMYNRFNRRLMVAAVRMADYRSFRDGRAREFLGGVGVDVSADQVYPDIVFGLPTLAASPRPPDSAEPLTVGVGTMLYEGYYGGDEAVLDEYVEKQVDFVVWLLGRGHRVRVLTGQETDWRAAERLLGKVLARGVSVPEGRLVAERVHSLHGVMEQIALTDVVVATRYHNLVCAFMLDKPAIAIDYARKNANLMADMGFPELFQHATELDVGRLIEQFSEVAENRERYVALIHERNGQVSARRERQEAIVAAWLSPPAA